jgi:hypothetical protein
MTKPAIDRPEAKKAAFSSYAVLWSMLGTLSLGYLGVAIFEPQWLGDLTPAMHDAQRAKTENAMMKLTAGVNGIKSSMAQLKLDVSSIKSDADAQNDRTKELGDRLTALEDKVRLSEMPVASAAPANPNAVASTEPDTSAGTDAGDQKASPSPKIINAASDKSKIVTGSVDKSPPAHKKEKAGSSVINFGPAVVKREQRPIGIQLASSASVEDLRLNWSQLANQHHDKLRRLKARYTTNGNDSNPTFNLIAGPVRTKAEAIKLCQDLQAQAVQCKVGDFTGNAL